MGEVPEEATGRDGGDGMKRCREILEEIALGCLVLGVYAFVSIARRVTA